MSKAPNDRDSKRQHDPRQAPESRPDLDEDEGDGRYASQSGDYGVPREDWSKDSLRRKPDDTMP